MPLFTELSMCPNDFIFHGVLYRKTKHAPISVLPSFVLQGRCISMFLKYREEVRIHDCNQTFDQPFTVGNGGKSLCAYVKPVIVDAHRFGDLSVVHFHWGKDANITVRPYNTKE